MKTNEKYNSEAALLADRDALLAALKNLLGIHDANLEIGGTGFFGVAEETGIDLPISQMEAARAALAQGGGK